MGKLAVAEFESITGLPEDRINNTFAFVGGEQATAAELTLLAQGIEDFYDGANTNQPLAFYMSPFIDRGLLASTVKVYDIPPGALGGHVVGDPSTHLGSPEIEYSFQLGAAGATNGSPQEVAVSLQWEASGRGDAAVETADGIDPGTEVDRPKQRLTGRVYIGPLGGSGITNTVPPARPAGGFLDDLRAAGLRLARATFATALGADMILGVWSRQNAAITTLEAVSVDDAFDTQRRRGVARSQVFRTAV